MAHVVIRDACVLHLALTMIAQLPSLWSCNVVQHIMGSALDENCDVNLCSFFRNVDTRVEPPK